MNPLLLGHISGLGARQLIILAKSHQWVLPMLCLFFSLTTLKWGRGKKWIENHLPTRGKFFFLSFKSITLELLEIMQIHEKSSKWDMERGTCWCRATEGELKKVIDRCVLMYKFSYEVMQKTVNTLSGRTFGEARHTLVPQALVLAGPHSLQGWGSPSTLKTGLDTMRMVRPILLHLIPQQSGEAVSKMIYLVSLQIAGVREILPLCCAYGERARRVKSLPRKPCGLSLISGAHVKGKKMMDYNGFCKVVLRSP